MPEKGAAPENDQDYLVFLGGEVNYIQFTVNFTSQYMVILDY